MIDDREGVTDNPAAHALPCGVSIAGRGPVHHLPKTLIMQEFVGEPYKYANIIPHWATWPTIAPRRSIERMGLGWSGSFMRFCQRVSDTPTAWRGV